MPVVEIEWRLRGTIVPFTSTHLIVLTEEIIDPNRSIFTGELFLLDADMINFKVYGSFVD